MSEINFSGEQDLNYGWGKGALALYLPSFFDYHVNYLASYGYRYFGQDRKQRYHQQANLVRNLDPRVFKVSPLSCIPMSTVSLFFGVCLDITSLCAT